MLRKQDLAQDARPGRIRSGYKYLLARNISPEKSSRSFAGASRDAQNRILQALMPDSCLKAAAAGRTAGRSGASAGRRSGRSKWAGRLRRPDTHGSRDVYPPERQRG